MTLHIEINIWQDYVQKVSRPTQSEEVLDLLTSDWENTIITAPGGPPPAHRGEEPPVRIIFTDAELLRRRRRSRGNSE